MTELEKILEERNARMEQKIREVLKKYMPERKVVSVRECWTPGWDAEMDNGDVVHFDSISYYPSCLSRRKVWEYYFIQRSNLKKVIYERR